MELTQEYFEKTYNKMFKNTEKELLEINDFLKSINQEELESPTPAFKQAITKAYNFCNDTNLKEYNLHNSSLLVFHAFEETLYLNYSIYSSNLHWFLEKINLLNQIYGTKLNGAILFKEHKRKVYQETMNKILENDKQLTDIKSLHELLISFNPKKELGTTVAYYVDKLMSRTNNYNIDNNKSEDINQIFYNALSNINTKLTALNNNELNTFLKVEHQKYITNCNFDDDELEKEENKILKKTK